MNQRVQFFLSAQLLPLILFSSLPSTSAALCCVSHSSLALVLVYRFSLLLWVLNKDFTYDNSVNKDPQPIRPCIQPNCNTICLIIILEDWSILIFYSNTQWGSSVAEIMPCFVASHWHCGLPPFTFLGDHFLLWTHYWHNINCRIWFGY